MLSYIVSNRFKVIVDVIMKFKDGVKRLIVFRSLHLLEKVAATLVIPLPLCRGILFVSFSDSSCQYAFETTTGSRKWFSSRNLSFGRKIIFIRVAVQ